MEVDAEIACEIVRNIGQLWLDGQLIDLQINIGDTVFNCSRLILCACSKFFQVLLRSEVKGEVEHPVRHVTLSGISPGIFQLVLNALYKGENGLDPDNMIEFWHAAHHLQIPVLVSTCETFISRHLTQENLKNIHWNALCLKSVNVTTAVQQFVAENFVTFKELDILLQQPVSFIEDIIGGDSIAGQSQDHVVEFILKWVNYELCARDTEHVCADSTVENWSTQRNEVTRNTNRTVEVFFEKPRVDFGDGCFRNPSGQPSVRKQFLGKLLKLVRFNEVSKDVWESLVDNDLVICSKEARDIVRQAMKLVNSAPTATASPDTEDTVVFVTDDNTSTICAYSLDREEIFKFYSTGDQIVNMHTHHTKLLWCVPRDSKSWNDPFIINIAEFPFSEIIPSTFSVENDAVIVGDFCYTSRGYMCRRDIKDGGWYKLFALPDYMSRPSLAVFKDSILYYNSKLNKHGKQEVYCFNTKSRNPWLVMTCDYQDCDFVTFTHRNNLYILYSNGVFVNVTQYVLSPVGAYSLPKYSEISKNHLLWDFQFKIYGAIVHRDNLIVFGDLSFILISEIHKCQIPGLKAIKFVHLYGLITKCHPLIIPKQRLTQRL